VIVSAVAAGLKVSLGVPPWRWRGGGADALQINREVVGLAADIERAFSFESFTLKHQFVIDA
jgi:hypothetical protein